jgi:hypothetical protein
MTTGESSRALIADHDALVRQFDHALGLASVVSPTHVRLAASGRGRRAGVIG